MATSDYSIPLVEGMLSEPGSNRQASFKALPKDLNIDSIL
jgi:hypothetical protein